MSGGVDSSVAALLLKQATPNNFSKLFSRPTPKGFRGYDVTGVFMRCYNIDGCAERDAEDARRVAEHIGIPFYVFDFEEEYKKRVVVYMVEGYRAGLTPNPDVMCNREIKFGLFFKKVMALGADYVATGHYARLKNYKIEGLKNSISGDNKKSFNYSIFQSKDLNKDQSYFLWTLTQNELSRTFFPVGDLLKPEVRAIAKKAELPTAEKKDSQGICFLGDVSLMDFLSQYLPRERGAVFNIEGKKIGEHEGAHFYTIGQRHIGVASLKKGGGAKPHYVVEKDIETNAVVVAEGSDHPALYRNEIVLTDVNFVNPPMSSLMRRNKRIEVMARVRYRQPLAPAVFKIAPTSSRIRNEIGKNGKWKIEFDQPVKFVAPGQSAVFYSKRGELLGGGIIV